MAALIAFLITTYFMPKFIRWFQRLRAGQYVRDDGPQSHLVKQGTPTMGGILIVWSIVVASVLFSKITESSVWILLFSLVASASLGFADDYLKIAKKNSKGVSSRAKMLFLALISFVVIFWAKKIGLVDSRIYFPFFKALSLDIGPWVYLWGFLVIAGASNAVNLTDGLDGLAIVPSMTSAVVLIVIAYLSGHALFSEYLQLQNLIGAGELAVVLASLVGAGLGFLWFNAHPAEIFMGDVGSLSLGSVLGTTALLIHQEFVLLIAGFLFVMETLSVMIQVVSYKSTKRRVFKMAPLHHHFELVGWPESKVIVRFWILSILFAVLALTTLKIR